MKFSIVMPSFLGEYKHAAKNREEKIVRAVNSVLDQDGDYELIVIADGCNKTMEIVQDSFDSIGGKLRLLRIGDDRKFGGKRNAGASGVPRNAGIQNAKGEYIVYLDIDDIYAPTYIADLTEHVKDKKWYWFDDLSWNSTTEQFDLHHCDIDTQGRCGTSNICHRADIGAYWSDKSHYLHDWMFISTLKAISTDYERLEIAGYGVCHVPNLLDV